MVHELRRNGGGLGLAAICSGGGQGDALLIEVLSTRGNPVPPRTPSLGMTRFPRRLRLRGGKPRSADRTPGASR